MARRPRPLLSALVAGAAIALTATTLQGGGSAQAASKPKPTKVVIILVDALSKEIVDKYDMDNVQALMADYVDTPNGYLGHTGSVTVVTHNVLTSGLLPKHMGWTNEGYRDVDDILPDEKTVEHPGDGLWITSNWDDEILTVQDHYGYPKLADYLNDSGVVATISPKAYAAYGFAGSGSDYIIRFGGTVTCDGQRYRFPAGDLPSYISAACGSPYLVERDKIYDTGTLPASLYPAVDDRYVVGDEAGHPGGDVWATNATLDVMENEDWSGLFVSLPGVDKAAHMWGGVNDPGPAAGGNPMTHMDFATATADAQVGRIMDALEESGELDNTIVVLTADHGSVGTAYAEDGTFPGEHFHGAANPALDHGLKNWYYGNVENDSYLDAQPALQPLVATENLGLSYSDSSVNVWLIDQSPDKVAEAAGIMEDMPDVTAVWRRDGDHYTRVSPVRWDLMPSQAERKWFNQHAQELVDTQAADYGPDLIATLPDHTTYSVAGDHGGIQRATQQIPIVFAGGGLGSRDVMAPVRSVDVMPTLLKALGLEPTAPMDGVAYPLPR